MASRRVVLSSSLLSCHLDLAREPDPGLARLIDHCYSANGCSMNLGPRAHSRRLQRHVYDAPDDDYQHVPAPAVRTDPARPLPRIALRTVARSLQPFLSDQRGEWPSQTIGVMAYLAAVRLATTLHRSGTTTTERDIRRGIGTLDVVYPRLAEFARNFVEVVRRNEGLLVELRTIGVTVPPEGLGWLYQYLRQPVAREATRNANLSGIKIEGDGLLAATQFFTDDYLVDWLVDSSLGDFRFDDISNLIVVDPACGGGNFLIAALRHLLSVAGPPQSNRIEHLFEHVLRGYDLDGTLGQIANLSLWLEGTLASGSVAPRPAHVFGGGSNPAGFLHKELASKLLRHRSATRRVVWLTNPPFMGRRLMSNALRRYLSDSFPESGNELCAAFLLRMVHLVRPGDRIALVHPTSLIYLSTYEPLRKAIFDRSAIRDWVELGSGAFVDISGEKARVAVTVLTGMDRGQKASSSWPPASLALAHEARRDKETRLRKASQTESSPQTLDSSNGPRTIVRKHGTLLGLLSRFPRYGVFARPMQGTSTGNNGQLVRMAWEVPAEDDRWRPVSKGGGACKWWGLHRYVVQWGVAGELVRRQPGSAIRNVDVIDRAHLVYSDTSGNGLTVRAQRHGDLFMASGPGILVETGLASAHLAVLNSRVVSALISSLTPKLTVSPGYLSAVPVPASALLDAEVAELADECIRLKQQDEQVRVGSDETIFPEPIFRDLNEGLCRILMDDLAREARRLDCELELDVLVRKHYDLPSAARAGHPINREIDRLTRRVSPRNRGANPALLQAHILDEILVGMLSPARRLARSASAGPRCEGPLEAASIAVGRSHRDLLAIINGHASSLTRTLTTCGEDLLHRHVLTILGFNNSRSWRPAVMTIRQLIHGLSDRLPIGHQDARILTGGLELNEWLRTRLPAIHSTSFHRRPILQISGDGLKLSRSAAI
jgi:N-6 DNA Methylase